MREEEKREGREGKMREEKKRRGREGRKEGGRKKEGGGKTALNEGLE